MQQGLAGLTSCLQLLIFILTYNRRPHFKQDKKSPGMLPRDLLYITSALLTG